MSDRPPSRKTRAYFYVALTALVVFVLWATSLIVNWIMGRSIPIPFFYRHLPLFVGIPFAMISAFIVVTFLNDQASEPIEISSLGFRYKGAAGQLVLWVVVFLAIVFSIRYLWPLMSMP
jgi:hypothetical protein